jgi:hypothetical protein
MKVSDLFNTVLQNLRGVKPTCSIADAVRLTHVAIVDRLVKLRSDILLEEVQIDIYANDDIITLPTGFITLFQRPQIVGRGEKLAVVGDIDTSQLQDPGTPRYYRIVGNNLIVYPPADADISIKLLVALRPETPVAMTDDLPFGGNIDQIYIDGVMAVLSGGYINLTAKSYVPLINTLLDQLLSGIALINEQTLAETINNYEGGY